MREKKEAFKSAADALLQLGVPDSLPVLRDAGVHLKRLILGGSHSVVTYPPLNSLWPVEEKEYWVNPTYFGDSTNLYIHIAYCETQCTFCHYDVKPYLGKAHGPQSRVDDVARYMEALYKEIEYWGFCLGFDGTKVSSIYVGGGTPLILETGELQALLAKLREEFDIIPGAEICIEGSPLTITAPGGDDKLKALREAGVTRLSFGVQSFDDEVLRRAARGYKREVAFKACELVSLHFPNWNLDLIQSLYKGRPDEVWENLQALRDIRPPHLTWYHGRFAKRPQGDWLENAEKRQYFETEEDTLLGRMLIWQELASMGYGQVDGNRFVREERYTDPFKKSRTSVTSNLVGIGASAYSHVDMRAYPRSFETPPGFFMRNVQGIDAYVTRINALTADPGNKLPFGSALPLDWGEYLAASYVVGLRTIRSDSDDDRFARKIVPQLSRHYRALERKLLSLGILERVAVGRRKGLKLTTLGKLFEDEVLSLFYSPNVQRELERG